RDSDTYHLLHRYSRDLVMQPFYLKLERKFKWFWIYLMHAAIFTLAGFGIGFLVWRDVGAAAQFAMSVLIWGVIVRTVLVWHITWSVSSLSHLWGYRTFKNTGENSRNNWFVALISNGEGWHNNHHGDQRSAAHGHKWWELDVSYWTIKAMEKVGL